MNKRSAYPMPTRGSVVGIGGERGVAVQRSRCVFASTTATRRTTHRGSQLLQKVTLIGTATREEVRCTRPRLHSARLRGQVPSLLISLVRRPVGRRGNRPPLNGRIGAWADRIACPQTGLWSPPPDQRLTQPEKTGPGTELVFLSRTGWKARDATPKPMRPERPYCAWIQPVKSSETVAFRSDAS